MNIITTKDTSRPGNDCWIYESVSLVEQFNVYAIIVCQSIIGWSPQKNIFVAQTTTDLSIAAKMFNDYTQGYD